MSTEDESDPAFPSDSNRYGAVLGMTLRDYFAAKALPVILVDSSSAEETAKRSYQLADAMLRARSQS